MSNPTAAQDLQNPIDQNSIKDTVEPSSTNTVSTSENKTFVDNNKRNNIVGTSSRSGIGKLGTSTIPSNINKITREDKGKFYIRYGGVSGNPKTWNFALLPAIESNLRMQSSSPTITGTGATVPEVKAGIVIITNMKHKNIVIPGGVPVVQTIGVENVLLQLCGAFIGTENSDNLKAKTESYLYPYNAGTGNRSDTGVDHSYNKARLFNTEVVTAGREVQLVVEANLSEGNSSEGNIALDYHGVIIGFKLYAVRKDRTYYCLDFLVTRHDITKALKDFKSLGEEKLVDLIAASNGDNQYELAEDIEGVGKKGDVVIGGEDRLDTTKGISYKKIKVKQADGSFKEVEVRQEQVNQLNRKQEVDLTNKEIRIKLKRKNIGDRIFRDGLNFQYRGDEASNNKTDPTPPKIDDLYRVSNVYIDGMDINPGDEIVISESWKAGGKNKEWYYEIRKSSRFNCSKQWR